MGISGAGKSTIVASTVKNSTRLWPNTPVEIVCPDEIRKELTGSISDQSQNARVFQLAHSRTKQYLSEGTDVIFDATNTRAKARKELIAIARGVGSETELIVLMDSANKAVCRQRVQADLDAGTDRSDTVCEDFIIDKQHNAFMQNLPLIDSEDWDKIHKIASA